MNSRKPALVCSFLTVLIPHIRRLKSTCNYVNNQLLIYKMAFRKHSIENVSSSKRENARINAKNSYIYWTSLFWILNSFYKLYYGKLDNELIYYKRRRKLRDCQTFSLYTSIIWFGCRWIIRRRRTGFIIVLLTINVHFSSAT